MAQAVDLAERQATLLTSCLREAGVEDEVVVDAGTLRGSARRNPGTESPAERKASIESRIAASERCMNEVTAQLPFPTESREQGYDKMAQTAECIRHNGYPEIGQPPSKATWVDTYEDPDRSPWSGYEELYRLHPDITESEWRTLRAVCAEGGVTFSVAFGDRPGTP